MTDISAHLQEKLKSVRETMAEMEGEIRGQHLMIVKALQMRIAQQEYFRDRDNRALQIAKDLEKEFDESVNLYLEGYGNTDAED